MQIKLGTLFEFKPDSNGPGDYVVINPMHLEGQGFTFSQLKINEEREKVISPLTGSELYESIDHVTGQLSIDEVREALVRGAKEGWDFNPETIEIAIRGGMKELG